MIGTSRGLANFGCSRNQQIQPDKVVVSENTFFRETNERTMQDSSEYKQSKRSEALALIVQVRVWEGTKVACFLFALGH